MIVSVRLTEEDRQQLRRIEQHFARVLGTDKWLTNSNLIRWAIATAASTLDESGKAVAGGQTGRDGQ